MKPYYDHADITLDRDINAVDLFCGAGGLTHGLSQAGIRVEAGIDIDKHVAHAFCTNNPGVAFLCWNVAHKNYQSIAKLFRPGAIRLLAGCPPCRPFSKLTNRTEAHKDRDLLDNFGRFIHRILPELVMMENVPELTKRGVDVFQRFLKILQSYGYWTYLSIVHCEDYGIPQSRKRLVLLASRLGKIHMPKDTYRSAVRWQTVRQTIAGLSPLAAGEEDPSDPLHVSTRLTSINLKRIRATPHDGGTWKDWPKHLLLPCHRRITGKSYSSNYGRMWWDKPGPTMTTLCTGLGNGRFGHPEQDRAITLREAALLQSFPPDYEFWPRQQKLNRRAVGRMIGNAIPPRLAKILGKTLMSHVESIAFRKRTYL